MLLSAIAKPKTTKRQIDDWKNKCCLFIRNSIIVVRILSNESTCFISLIQKNFSSYLIQPWPLTEQASECHHLMEPRITKLKQKRSPFGENTRRLMGMEEMPLFEPVIRSVSASISLRTWSKSVNFLFLQCKNSAYSVKKINKIQSYV